MRITPDNCDLLGDGLDHPESVCLGPNGAVYAGGEAGQVYRLTASSGQCVVGSTGGFLLGIALDGNGNIHACDVAAKSLMCIAPSGNIYQRATSAGNRDFENPNHGVFDAAGNFYMSDSGDYWQQTTGTGYIARVDVAGQSSLFHEGPFLFPNGVALHPSEEWLYIAQSTAGNIVRIPLDRINGSIETTHRLPAGVIPDGITFASDGTLVIACYKPDALFLGQPDGTVELLCEDPTGELLSRPTNAALGDGKLYVSNLGGWHITVIDTAMLSAPVHRPVLSLH